MRFPAHRIDIVFSPVGQWGVRASYGCYEKVCFVVEESASNNPWFGREDVPRHVPLEVCEPASHANVASTAADAAARALRC